MRLKSITAALVVILTDAAALACITTYEIDPNMSDGSALVTVNGVFHDRINGDRPFPSKLDMWTIEGENTVKISLEGTNKGKFLLSALCEGDFFGRPVTEWVEASNGEVATFTFEQKSGIDAAFAATVPSDDAGLVEAFDQFRQAVLARDTKTVLKMIEPLLARADAEGVARSVMVSQVTRAIEKGEVTAPDSLVFTAVAGGRIHQILTPDYEKPLVLRYTTEDGLPLTLELGGYWTRIGGEWQLISN